MPPGCADETVTVTLEAYLPSSTQEHCILSAVFDVTTSVETLKKPVTLHIPHCVNIKSEEDKERLRFLILHKDSHEFKKGYFKIGKSFGSVELDKFSKAMIVDIFSPCLDQVYFFVTSFLKASTDVKLKEEYTGEASVKEISKRYLDLLILPKSAKEICETWHGKYCIIQDIPTYWQVSKVMDTVYIDCYLWLYLCS